MKKFFAIIIVLFSMLTFAQKKQNILITKQFEFQSEPNSYNINYVLRAILVSNNFNVFFDDEVLPTDIAQNRCNAITGVLLNTSSMFATKVKLQFKDCKNVVIFESEEVKSKEKDMQMGFLEAIKLLSPEIKKYKASVFAKKELDVATSENVIVSNLKHQLAAITNGFVVMDESSKLILQIYKTSTPNVFIADKSGVKGVFTKQDNKGVFEYYLYDKLVVEEYLF